MPNGLSPRDLVFRPDNMDETVPHTLYRLNRLKPPVIFYVTDRSKAVLLIWLSVFLLVLMSLSFLFSPSVFLADI